MLASAGKAYDEEAQSMAKQLTSLLEPLMILLLGVVVGFIILGLYMPMFGMFDAINGPGMIRNVRQREGKRT